MSLVAILVALSGATAKGFATEEAALVGWKAAVAATYCIRHSVLTHNALKYLASCELAIYSSGLRAQKTDNGSIYKGVVLQGELATATPPLSE